MNIKDFKVGQAVWVELTENARRGEKKEECIEEWEITYVGRKYIKAVKKEDGIFRFETIFEWSDSYQRFVQKTDYCVNYVLHETRQEIEDKHERNRLFGEISEVFRRYGTKKLTLEQLQRIKEILDESGD